jgi:predicted amidohydrolase
MPLPTPAVFILRTLRLNVAMKLPVVHHADVVSIERLLMSSASLFRSVPSIEPKRYPDGWEPWSSQPALTPRLLLEPSTGRSGSIALGVQGMGSLGLCAGWSRRISDIQSGKAYRFSAFYRAEHVPDERRSIVASLQWFDAAGKRLRKPDFILPTPTTGQWTRLEHWTYAPEAAHSVVIQLGLRWSAVGTVYFDDVEFRLDPEPPQRVIQVASAYLKMSPGETGSSAKSVERLCRLVDGSLPAGTDVLCLGEGVSVAGTGMKILDCAEPVPGGPTLQRLGELARKHHCYVVAGIYERKAAITHNTAILLDRDGKLVGTYRKTHLPHEEVEAGLVPGDIYPVFDTDFGRIGIMICWDIHFPEPARAMAMKGAELLLVPIWGGNETLARARAIENHVFLVTAGYDIKTMILDPLGETLAEAALNPAEPAIVSAQVRLDQKFFQPWLGNMKTRIWAERRADLAGALADGVRPLRFVDTHGNKPFQFKVAEGHPRVLVRPEDLPVLRERSRTTHRAEMESLLAFAAGPGSEPGPNGDFTHSAPQLAFLYMLTGDKAHAAAAIRAVEGVLAAPVEGFYFTGQRRLRALACVYDWAFDALSEELRERIADACVAYTRAIYGGEIEVSAFIAGHAVNMMPYILAAGLAIADEGAGRTLITAFLRWFDKALPNWKFFLEKNSFQQSYAYTAAYVPDALYMLRLMETGLGMDLFEQNAWLRNVVPWWTYAFRADGTFIRHGDYFCSAPMLNNPGYFRGFALIAWKYRDGLAQWWTERFRLGAQHAEVEQFIFNPRDGKVAPQPPDHLPRTRFFEGMGIAIARGDWDTAHGPDTGGTVAAFRCPPYYLHNHNHRDANQITLYHKGDQAIDSGVYDDYESSHWRNYYIRTIAHNTIVVHDPRERMILRGIEYANDGGQRWINEPHWSPRDYTNLLDDDTFKDGTVLAYRESSDHTYVCGDASNCYSPAKLTRFLRHVVFVLDWPHKAAVSMVILDEIELARDGLTPRFLLHSTAQPQAQAQRVTIHQGAGRLTATVLHPTPAKIELIGGPGKEWWVDGKNYPPGKELQGPHTPGAWRAEISPTAASRTIEFLTLLAPADANAPQEPAPTARREGSGWVIQQGDLTVNLVRQEARSKSSGGRVISVLLAHAKT